jgi:protein-disulfide isomerase
MLLSARLLTLCLLMTALVACSDESASSKDAVTASPSQATTSNDAPATATPASPGAATDPVAVPPAGFADRALGNADAPVTVVEYASLTCQHCSVFHTTILPTLSKKYIETGKVRWVYRDFPLDGLALAASQLGRCLPEDSYFGFIGVLLENQERWRVTDGNLEPLRQLAMLAGLTAAQITECEKNSALQQALIAERLRASNAFKIQATPTVFVAGKAVADGLDVATVSKAIDRALAAAGKE